MQAELNQLQADFELIGDVRGIGLLWGIELVTSRVTKEKASAQAEAIMYECLKNGLSFKVSKGNVLQFCPALTITETQLAEALNILRTSFHKITQA